MHKKILSILSRFSFPGVLPFGSVLTHVRSILLSYGNQSHVLKNNSVDWLLYDGDVDLN